MTKRVKVGLIGSGTISGVSLKNLTQVFNNIVDVVGCSDLIPERAQRRAEEYGIKALTNEQILNDPEIEMVINTTYMQSHYPVTKQILEAGKHAYSEKCMSLKVEWAKELMDLAKSKNLLLGTAPDTFLGGGFQTCIKLVDTGFIGEPRGASLVLARGGASSRRRMRVENAAEPLEYEGEEYAGTLHDVGVYYITGLVAMFGPIKRIAGNCKILNNEGYEYKNPANPKFGQKYYVKAPELVTATIEFESGMLANLILTSAASMGELPVFDVFGSEAHLYCGDINMYHGPVMMAREGSGYNAKAIPVQLTHGYLADCRGIGAADFAAAIKNGRKPRVSGELAYHVLEALTGIMISSDSGKDYVMESTCERPKPLRSGVKLANYVIDD